MEGGCLCTTGVFSKQGTALELMSHGDTESSLCLCGDINSNVVPSLADSLPVEEHIEGVLHRTCGNDLTGVDEEDLVGIRDRIQPVRDDDLGCRFRELTQNLLQLLFGNRIDVGGGLVKNENFRIAQDRPHESDDLFLTQTDRVASGEDLGLQALFEPREQTADISLVQKRDEIGIRIVPVLFVAVKNVVSNRACKQERLLKNEADSFRSLFRPVRTDISSIQQNAPAGRVVEARHQRCGGRLAAARRTDKGVGFPGLQSEIASTENLLAARIAEMNIFKFQNASRPSAF